MINKNKVKKTKTKRARQTRRTTERDSHDSAIAIAAITGMILFLVYGSAMKAFFTSSIAGNPIALGLIVFGSYYIISHDLIHIAIDKLRKL